MLSSHPLVWADPSPHQPSSAFHRVHCQDYNQGSGERARADVVGRSQEGKEGQLGRTQASLGFSPWIVNSCFWEKRGASARPTWELTKSFHQILPAHEQEGLRISTPGFSADLLLGG